VKSESKRSAPLPPLGQIQIKTLVLLLFTFHFSLYKPAKKGSLRRDSADFWRSNAISDTYASTRSDVASTPSQKHDRTIAQGQDGVTGAASTQQSRSHFFFMSHAFVAEGLVHSNGTAQSNQRQRV
jgi:hypothetical protein